VKIGDRVEVDLSKGCLCKCGRTDKYRGTIVSFDHPLGRKGMVKVGPDLKSGNFPWEFKQLVEVVDE